ncbi:carbon-nitrogen hydrolase family protein [Paracoccus sp. NGMCC 1.201697]|uniref:Carbon-nitrogen hydrolase family protein n=1 Tax=Paracoccus broussonetiae subsp. drimophilus TaxID=3373869 RepID=A0ABW7LHE5_9RHOB
MKLALWQTAPTNGRIEAGFDALCMQVQAAAAAGAKLLLAPELFLPGYNRPDLHAALAQPLDGEWMGRLREVAARTGCGICIGWAERDGAAVHNAATTIGPDGAILGHYRKIQLYGAMEQASFAPGDRLCAPFRLEGLRVSMLVCYDIEFPGHAAALSRAGTDLILVPTANPVGFEHVPRRLVPARAHESDATVAYANLAGAEGEVTFGGLSVIAGPDGEQLASAGARGDALLIVDLAATASIPSRLRSGGGRDYRPALK